MVRTKILDHTNCLPPDGNPKGYLKSIFISANKNITIRIPGYMACDVCKKLVTLTQVDL